jgi:predicted ATP-dependent Lon-type protease
VFDIAKRVGRTHFIPNAVNEHMHFTTGKSTMDDTYERNRTQQRGNLYEKDKIIFENTTDKRQKDADKLMEIINGQACVSSEEPTIHKSIKASREPRKERAKTAAK